MTARNGANGANGAKSTRRRKPAPAAVVADPPTGAMGRGVTADSIKLGFVYPKGTYGGASADGGAHASDRAIDLALIAWFNQNGGIAGRKIEPVFYENDEQSSKTYRQREQERCVVFTEDNQVFAVYPHYTSSENEAACLAGTGTQLVVTNTAANASGRFDDESFRRYPNVWGPVTPSANRTFAALVNRAHAAKYFEGGGVTGVRLGLLYTDEPASRRAVERSLKPALKAKGQSIAQEAAIMAPYNINDLAPMTSQIQSAVLRFRTNNISHVMIPTGLGSIIAGQFMRVAESQGYRPRYALESGSAGLDREPFSGTDVTPQLKGAVYMGWDPSIDVGDQASTQPARDCDGAMKKAGIKTPDPRGGGVCDFLLFLKAGLDGATDVTPGGLAAGIRKAGRVAFVRTWSSDFGSGNHDGASLVRMAHFDFACHEAGGNRCWRYDTPQMPL